jgi:hypothetical protein
MSKKRLVRQEDLPHTLWDADRSLLHLSPDLISTWHHLLDTGDLYATAIKPAPENVIGGIDKVATDQHLAWRFTGSSARVQLAMLDPNNDLPEVADALARAFSGGTVLLTDVPCGSGAAALSILSIVAELRRQERFPRFPLTVKLVGGELSEFARDYASLGIQHLLATLNEQAIWVEPEFLSWDALSKFSTADLIKRLILLGEGCSARVLVLANFSGFLQGKSKWNDAAPQFEDLFVHSRDLQSVAIWIEPQTNSVLDKNGGFFCRVLKWFSFKFSGLIKKGEEEQFQISYVGISEAQVQHPLREDQQFRVNLAVKHFDLPVNGAGS